MNSVKIDLQNGFSKKIRFLIDSHSPPLIFIGSIILIWELIVQQSIVSRAVLPAPSQILAEFISNLHVYLLHSYFTFKAIMVGLVVGSIIGMLFGVAIFYIPFFRLAFYPLITMIALTPKIAFAPLLVIWFGAGFLSKIVLAILVVFFPTLVNTYSGLTDIDEELLTLNRMYNVDEWFLFRKIRVPNALPYLVSGVKLGIVFSVIGTIVAEYIASSRGIGFLIVKYSTFARTDRAFAALFSIVILVLTLYGLAAYFERKLLFWYTES